MEYMLEPRVKLGEARLCPLRQGEEGLDPAQKVRFNYTSMISHDHMLTIDHFKLGETLGPGEYID